MSKTYDNCIWLEDSAKDMYGKILGIEDRLITTYMECCTDIPMEEIITIEKAMNKEENPMQFKKELAYEIVRMYHGEEAAKNAAAEFTKVFTDKQMPSDIPEVKAKNGEFLLDFLLREKLIASKGEGRRLLEQKGIHCDDKAVMDVNAPASPGTYKVGKRKFIRIV
jgi:tyrosyl-tRNA synthetase